MERDPIVAREIIQRLEAIHVVTYFAPEAVSAMADAGYRGFWMGYFAGRAAPLGPVGPEVVSALFYNFAGWRVARAIPDAWSFAPPSAALDARRTGAVAALRRAIGDSVDGEEVAEAARLASKAAREAPLDGRALFAANSALPWPDEPVAVLWHASTLLREHRGDGHVAALLAAGISGREAHVLHSAAGRVAREVLTISRDYTDEEWDALTERLIARGLLTSDGGLSDEGRALKDDVEARTDRLALSAYDALSDDEVRRLTDLTKPLARAVVAAGDIGSLNPIGLGLPATESTR
jgi:hypothetical protein